MRDLNLGQKIFMIVLYCLTAISFVVSGFVIYQLATIKKPFTIGVTYADKLSYDESQRSIANVKINSNDNNNGLAVYDLQFSSYTDTEGNGVTSFGIQCTGDWEIHSFDYLAEQMIDNLEEVEKYKADQTAKYGNSIKTLENSFVFGNFHFYYTGDNGVTYTVLSEDMIDNYLLIDIDGEFYRLVLNTYTTHTVHYSNWWNKLWGIKSYKEVEVEYSWYHLFDYIMNSALKNSGTEDFSEFPLALLDCSEFIKVEKLDSNGQYYELENTAEIRNYLIIPVEYTKDGALDTSDSLFKMVNSSTSWSYYGQTDVKEYWNAYSELLITEKNLNFVYNSEFDKYYITIDNDFSKYLDKLSNTEISICIDLDNIDFDIYALDLQNFTFDIKSFVISSEIAQDFTIYNQSACEIVPTFNFGGNV